MTRACRAGSKARYQQPCRTAINQARYHPPAREFLQRRRASGYTKTETIRGLKRRLSDVVYRALLTDASCAAPQSAITTAA